MSIKARLQRLEQKSTPDLMEVTIIRFSQNEPLPVPHMSGNVKVSYHYASDEEKD
jgi:hypothetical protein